MTIVADLAAHLTQDVFLATDQLLPFFDIRKKWGVATSQGYLI